MAKRLLARVKQLRESLELTQEAFAERAGLGYKYYQSVEAGRRRDIRLSTLEKLAKACGLAPWELLDFDKQPLVAHEEPAEFQTKANKRPARPAKGTRTKG
jgi:transcriptional regulator with XRE-family HTH domain